MNIISHGVDIVNILRIKSLLQTTEDHWETRCFTTLERQIATDSGPNRVQCLAGRFAAKEAVMKALGTGWSKGISFKDIEIQKLPTGCPTVVLIGKCQEIADALGISSWLLSISHEETYAIASVISIGQMPDSQ